MRAALLLAVGLVGSPLRPIRARRSEPLDFDALLAGTETTMEDATGCPPGITVSEWTVAGGSHVPSPSRAGVDAIWAWMAAHPKR
jgi:hypothetical protein